MNKACPLQGCHRTSRRIKKGDLKGTKALGCADELDLCGQRGAVYHTCVLLLRALDAPVVPHPSLLFTNCTTCFFHCCGKGPDKA